MCVEEMEQNNVCHQCIGDSFLSAEIEGEGTIHECDYCGDNEEPTIPLAEVADRVETVFDDHFERTPAEPNWYEEQLLKDKEISFSWWREGQPTIDVVIIPFLTGCGRRTYAAILSFWAGVMPPMPIFGRSLL